MTTQLKKGERETRVTHKDVEEVGELHLVSRFVEQSR